MYATIKYCLRFLLGARLSKITLGTLTSRTDETILYLPKRVLDYGLYEFSFTVSMDIDLAGNNYSASTKTYVKVIPAPLVADFLKYSPGTRELRVSNQQDLCIQHGEASYNPDNPDDKVS